MKNSKHNTGFESLDKKFNTKEVTKALEKNLEKTKEEKNTSTCRFISGRRRSFI